MTLIPLYDFACPDGHTLEKFFHRATQADDVIVCECGAPMTKVLSMGRGLTYFESGRARTIWNLSDQPIVVTSHEQHKKLMREHKVDWATAGTGRKGCWQ